MIEKGVPIPPPTRGGGPPPRKRANPDHEAWRMKVGESLFCETEKEARKVQQMIYKLGGKPCLRKIKREGWRVWRVQ